MNLNIKKYKNYIIKFNDLLAFFQYSKINKKLKTILIKSKFLFILNI